jgi:hypothetical protein
VTEETRAGNTPANTPEAANNDLREMTLGLGQTLKHIADSDPAGTPTAHAATVFHEWLAEAGRASERPELFADVAAHYEIQANSNRDLFLLFDMLVNYTDIDEEEPAALGTFIGLPMAK